MRKLLVLLLLTSIGCATIKGYPTRYSDPAKELRALQAEFTIGRRAACESARNVACRDVIVSSLIQAIDLQYDDFRRKLFQAGGSLNLSADLATLGLSIAGTQLAAAGTKSILAAAASLVTGAKGAIGKDVMLDKAVTAWLSQMDVLRAEQRSILQARLAQPWSGYSLSAALIDIEGYYSAGTIPAAINSINAATGARVEQMRVKP